MQCVFIELICDTVTSMHESKKRNNIDDATGVYLYLYP